MNKIGLVLVFLVLFGGFTFLQFGLVPRVQATTAFSTVNVTSIHTCPLDTHTFVIAYHDETNDDFSFQIYDTNGTQVLAETDVNTTSGGSMLSTSVGVSAFNSTTFVIGWYDQTDDDATFAVYNTTGSSLSGPTDADTNVGGGSWSVQVSCFNSTHFVIAWYDYTDKDATFSVYTSSSVLVAGPTDTDTDIGSEGFSVSVSTFNSTTFVIGWYDRTDNDVTFAVYESAGTNMTMPIDADLDAGSSMSVSVSTLNSTYFVIGWFDRIDQDATFAIYDSAGTLKTGSTDADLTAGSECYSTQVSALNSTAFVISWYDYTDLDLSFATYLSDNTTITALTDIESWPTIHNSPFQEQSPCSQETGTGIKLYNDNWVIAYANTTTQAIWKAFYPNGTVWDGTIPAGGDSTKPTYSGISTNSTVWATPCNFSITINDETALHPNGQYVFGCNNTGPFTNETAINFTTTSQLVSIVKTLNSTNPNATSPEIVQFEWWFSDNAGNLNNTGLQTLTLSWQLSVGWNNVTIFEFDAGYTLAGINASLNYDNISWTYIVYQNSSVTAQYVFVKNMSANNLVRVYQTTGILLIFCNAAGSWTHTYPYQGGDYGEDPTPYVVAAVSLGIAVLAVTAYKKLRKKKAK